MASFSALLSLTGRAPKKVDSRLLIVAGERWDVADCF